MIRVDNVIERLIAQAREFVPHQSGGYRIRHVLGGGGEIRTRARLAPPMVFGTRQLNHSCTPPLALPPRVELGSKDPQSFILSIKLREQ